MTTWDNTYILDYSLSFEGHLRLIHKLDAAHGPKFGDPGYNYLKVYMNRKVL